METTSFLPPTLSLDSNDLDTEALQDVTRRLCRNQGDEAGLEASLATQPADRTSKGDLPVLGQIAIAAIGSGGAVVALIGVLKAYVQRGKALKIKVQKENGDKIEIDGKNLGSE